MSSKDIKKYEAANVFEAVKLKFYSKSVEELVQYIAILTGIVFLMLGIWIYKSATSGKLSTIDQCSLYAANYEKSYLNYVAGEKVDNSAINNSFIKTYCSALYEKQIKPREELYDIAIKAKNSTAELEKKLSKFANVENVVKQESSKIQSLLIKCNNTR